MLTSLLGRQHDALSTVLQGALSGTSCWGAFDDKVLGLYDHINRQGAYLQASRIVLATGAGDLGLPFPGWTLPGVLGGHAALDLLEQHVPLPGQRVVVLGSGQLAIACATAVLEAGYSVAALVDVGELSPAAKGLKARLIAHDVELLPHYVIREARGVNVLDHIVVAPVDGGFARSVRTDALIVAIGEAPIIELAYLLGCEIAFDARRGGHYPLHNRAGRTSAPGVYVIGGAAGDFDADTYAERASHIVAALIDGGAGPLPQEMTPESSPGPRGAHLTEWHRIIVGNLSDSDIVCRCENVSRAAVLRSYTISGEALPDEAKRVSRVGAGVCQGRCCRHTVMGLLAEHTGVAYAELAPPSLRPPVRPAPMWALAQGDVTDPPLLGPFDALLQELQQERDAGRIPAAAWATVLFRLKEENAYIARGHHSPGEVEEAAQAFAVRLRALPPH